MSSCATSTSNNIAPISEENQTIDVDLTDFTYGTTKRVQIFEDLDDTNESDNLELEKTLATSSTEMETKVEQDFFELGKKAPTFSIKYIFPIENVTRLSSIFGKRHGKMHLGIDIPGKTGTPIVSVNDGIVVFSGVKSGYGNIVILKHLNNIFSIYAHAKKTIVQKGDLIKKAQTIAYVGSTGRSTGPHLHFEIREGQKAIDPLIFYKKNGL